MIPGWSTQVEIPQRADVLISEIIGNDPFAENVLFSTTDAINRFLKPNPRLIPEQIQAWGLPVTVPEKEWQRRRVTPATLMDWQTWYDLDLSALTLMDVGEDHPLFSTKPYLAESWPQLSDPVLLATVDLSHIPPMPIQTMHKTPVLTAGLLNGLLVYSEIHLSAEIQLSTHPQACEPSCSWRNGVWALPQPVAVEPGESIGVEYVWMQKSSIHIHVNPT